jgi:2-polyprenyl-3-methyl-5-hydroxy-6-metoxy-1,4-benzoquinol methylase
VSVTALKPVVPEDLGQATRSVVDALLATWPDHAKFIRHSFADRSSELAAIRETVASLLLRVADESGRPLAAWMEDYRFLCEGIVFPEELFFRRNDRYRLSTFADALATVYNDSAFMARYMNGLFVSDVLWLNHARAMQHFRDAYLAKLPAAGRHLEIGPGHGMLLHLAIESGRFDAMTAWDVSPTSVAHTKHMLSVIGHSGRVEVRQQNFLAPDLMKENTGRFSTVVLSEVLEHLEHPEEAMRIIAQLLHPEHGTVWINVPANAPAPDHLFLLRSLEQLEDLLRSVGLAVADSAAFPVTGATLEKAIRDSLPVSYVVVARRAAA